MKEGHNIHLDFGGSFVAARVNVFGEVAVSVKLFALSVSVSGPHITHHNYINLESVS